jgi:ferredoxin
MTTHKVTLRSNGSIQEVVEVSENVDLLTALREKNIYIKSSCGGHATCSDCIIKVVSGEDNLESPPFEELKLLGNVFHITKERLACQTKCIGDISIDISKHDKASDEAKLKNKTSKFQAKKAVTKVRSREEVYQIKEERYVERTKRNENEASWQKHWEKGEAPKAKNLGGNKRPKFFDADKVQDQRNNERPRFEKNESKKEETENSKSNTEFKKFRRD